MREVFHQYYVKIKENGLQLLSTGGAKALQKCRAFSFL
jgi:hypothetical protein